jgi:hypothetical protein
MLSFVHLNEDTTLVVRVSGEDFQFFGGDSGVTLDESGHDTSGSDDIEWKRGNIEEKVLSLLRSVPGKDGSLQWMAAS